MYGSESELTDIDDDDYKASSTSKKKAPEKGTYKIRNALKVPRATTYTAQALYDQIHSSDIDLEPEYQRDVVWPESKQSGLIDSVLRNFYIPPVIFAVKVHDDGSELRTCIDGKQRLTSIHRFMDGLIAHKDPFTNEKLWYKDIDRSSTKGKKKKILPDKYRRLFANKQIVCVEYQDITDSDERDIFQRVQLGMALTPAEKMQVSSGPRAKFTRDLQATYLKESALLGDSLEWDRSRGGDFRNFAQAVYAIESYPSRNIIGTTPQMEKWLDQIEPLDKAFQDKIHATFRVFVELVHDKKLNKIFKKPARVSPIEFSTISLLISVHKDNMSLVQLSKAIELMRENVRSEHVDIRSNGKVAKTMVEFVKKLGSTKVKSEGESAGAAVGQKRKREEEDNPKAGKKTPVAKASSTDRPPPGPPPGSAPTAPQTTGQVDAKPVPAPKPPIAPVPDRLAALRAAKGQSSAPRPIPSAPAALRPPSLPAQPQPRVSQSSRPQAESSVMESMFPDRTRMSGQVRPNGNGVGDAASRNGARYEPNGGAGPYNVGPGRGEAVYHPAPLSVTNYDHRHQHYAMPEPKREDSWDERGRTNFPRPPALNGHNYSDPGLSWNGNGNWR